MKIWDEEWEGVLESLDMWEWVCIVAPRADGRHTISGINGVSGFHTKGVCGEELFV